MIEFIEYGTTITGEKLFARVDDDGLIRYTCIEEDAAYQAWLNPAEQSTPSVTNGD
jgi:hypothetical protein